MAHATLTRRPAAALRRLARSFIAHAGSMLLLFGAGLFLIGAVVEASREWRLARLEQAGAPPDVAVSLGELPAGAPGIGAGLSSAPGASPASGDRAAPVLPGAGAAADPGPSPTPEPALLPERIAIPAIGLDVPVVEVGWEARIVNGEAQGNVWQTADFAAGFHRDSAPLGRPGNTVISGHNNIRGAVFARLYDLQPGDEIRLFGGEQDRVYAVENKYVVREEGASEARRAANARWIQATPDERLTLVSCYPPWGNSHRVLVVAKPLPADGAGRTARAEPAGPGAAEPLGE